MKMLGILRDYIRPLSTAAMVILLLLGATISGVLEAAWPGLGIKFTTGVAGWFRAIPDTFYQLTGLMGGGYIAARSFEKVTETRSTAKVSEARAVVEASRNLKPDTPEGG